MLLRTLAGAISIAALIGVLPAAAATVTGQLTEAGVAWVSQGRHGNAADESSISSSTAALRVAMSPGSAFSAASTNDVMRGRPTSAMAEPAPSKAARDKVFTSVPPSFDRKKTRDLLQR